MAWIWRTEAGASAERHYRRWRAAYRRQMRWPLAVVLAFGALLAVAVLVFWPWEHAAFIAGANFGAAFTLVVWLWDEPPEVIRRWRRGAEGERATAKALRPLARRGWRTFHDLASPRGNLDHVVVGPGGVFLLDSKNVLGRLVVEENALHARFDHSPVNDYAFTRLTPALAAAARRLRGRLHEQLGWIVDVRPVVVLVSDEFEQGVARIGHVTYVAVAELARWLESQPRRLADRDIATVSGAVSRLPQADDVPFNRDVSAGPASASRAREHELT